MAGDRERLRALFPSWDVRPAAEVIERELAGVSPVAIADLVLDKDEAVWRREACAKALAGRVPDERAMALVAYVCDNDFSALLIAALVEALNVPGRPYRDALRARVVERGNSFIAERLNPRALLDEAASGDAVALRLLTVLAASPWKGRQAAGERAIDELIERHGLDAVLAMFEAGSPDALARSALRPAERLLGLRLLRRAGGDVSSCLGDESPMVSRTAYDLLSDGYGDDSTLLTMVREGRPGYLWALPILHRRGHDIRPLWEGAGSPRVEVPGVPPDVREAIVRRYTPGQRGTDPRWLIEAALLDPPPPPGELYDLREERLDAARQALADAGLRPGEPVPAGRSEGSGEGTYHVIATEAGKVWVSTLGPYFRFEGDARVKTALQDAGFRHIDPELGETRFTGLAVYFFGSREPLSVGNLLFYWQD